MTSFYDIKIDSLQGKPIDLQTYKNKYVLFVNVASKCGFTPQYDGLQSLQEKYDSDQFSVLAFPCNQFGGQEPGTDNEIQEFCSNNFKTTFPVFSKIDVNGENAHPLYKFLCSEKKRGSGFRKNKMELYKISY
jgi:glutathione peroxidase